MLVSTAASGFGAGSDFSFTLGVSSSFLTDFSFGFGSVFTTSVEVATATTGAGSFSTATGTAGSMINDWPTLRSLPFSPLSFITLSTDTPYFLEIEKSVSPGTTLCKTEPAGISAIDTKGTLIV